jgi:hypothetical protein
MTEPGCQDAMQVTQIRLAGDLRYADNQVANIGTFQRTTEGWALIRISPIVQTYIEAVALSDAIEARELSLDEERVRATIERAEEEAETVLRDVWRAYQAYWAQHSRATILETNLAPLAPNLDWDRIEIYVSQADDWTASFDLRPAVEGRCYVAGRALSTQPSKSHYGVPWCDTDAALTEVKVLEEMRVQLAELVAELQEAHWPWP